GNLPDVVRPAIQSVARTVRLNSEAKLRGDHHVAAEWRERFSNEFFVDERAIRLSSVEKRDATLNRGADDLDGRLPFGGWAVVGAQPHATVPESRHFRTVFAEAPFFHRVPNASVEAKGG